MLDLTMAEFDLLITSAGVGVIATAYDARELKRFG
jgi:hypothetical protein